MQPKAHISAVLESCAAARGINPRSRTTLQPNEPSICLKASQGVSLMLAQQSHLLLRDIRFSRHEEGAPPFEHALENHPRASNMEIRSDNMQHCFPSRLCHLLHH